MGIPSCCLVLPLLNSRRRTLLLYRIDAHTTFNTLVGSCTPLQQHQADGMRRQTLSSREDTAHFRAENLRLSDELRSCKQRLNAALDAQDDVSDQSSSSLP
jgi:hypothetical protein